MIHNTDFLRSITLEENPLADEHPDEVHFFDLDGNEVTADAAE